MSKNSNDIQGSLATTVVKECQELKSIIETFITNVKSSNMSAEVLQSNISRLEQQYQSWNQKSPAFTHFTSQMNEKDVQNMSIRSKSSTKGAVLTDLIDIMAKITSDSSIVLPISEDGSSTIPITSISWGHFQFQTANYKRFGINYTSPSILKQAIQYQKQNNLSIDLRLLWAQVIAKEANRICEQEGIYKFTVSNPETRMVAGALDVVVQDSKIDQVQEPSLKKKKTGTKDDEQEEEEEEVKQGDNTTESSTSSSSNTAEEISTTGASKRSSGNDTSTGLSSIDDELLEQVWGSTPTSQEVVQPSRHCINPYDTNKMQIYQFETMGYVDSCFKFKYGTPRQGSVVPNSRAKLVLQSSISADSVDGLLDYSHVWIIFVFHSNTQSKYKPKICPPRLHGQKVGCLATRTPHRWNDIGLSLVKIDRIEVPKDMYTDKMHGKKHIYVHNTKNTIPGCVTLYFSGIDLVDGTPVLDIKPFHPSDIPGSTLRIPQWLQEAPMAALQVQMSTQASTNITTILQDYYTQRVEHLVKKYGEKDKSKVAELQALNITQAANGSLEEPACMEIYEQLGSPFTFYRTRRELVDAIKTTLSMDPRPICTKKRHSENAIYGFVYDQINVIYRMADSKTAVISIIELRDDVAQANRKRELMNKEAWLKMVREKIEIE